MRINIFYLPREHEDTGAGCLGDGKGAFDGQLKRKRIHSKPEEAESADCNSYEPLRVLVSRHLQATQHVTVSAAALLNNINTHTLTMEKKMAATLARQKQVFTVSSNNFVRSTK